MVSFVHEVARQIETWEPKPCGAAVPPLPDPTEALIQTHPLTTSLNLGMESPLSQPKTLKQRCVPRLPGPSIFFAISWHMGSLLPRMPHMLRHMHLESS